MARKSGLPALGLVITLSAFVACGGGEAGQTGQQAESGASGSGEATGQAAPATEGGAMQQQGRAMLPEGVTQEMVNQGQQLFVGDGLCFVCHGREGKGMASLGADLTDSEWIHGDGSYEFIVQNIMTGVSAEKSTTGTAMPPKGGSSITDEQVKAVAAYVYSIGDRGS